MHRLERIANQVSENSWRSPARLGQRRAPQPCDIVICCAVRTPITRAKRGGQLEDTMNKRMKEIAALSILLSVRIALTLYIVGLAEAFPEDLLKPLFEAIVERTRIDPKEIQDVCIGNVLQPGGGALSSRIAQILGGIPDSTALHTVNRQCSSGLQVKGS